MDKPRNKVVAARGAARETTKGLTPGKEAPGGAATGGVATRNGAKTGRGSSCKEANKAKEDPVP